MIEIEFLFYEIKGKMWRREDETERETEREREKERETLKKNEGTEPCVLSSSLIERATRMDDRRVAAWRRSSSLEASLISDNRRGLCYRPGSAGWIVLSRVRYSPSRRERLKGGEWRGVSVHRDQ